MAGTGTAHLRAADEALLRVEDLVVEFPVGRTGCKVHAVSDISLDVLEGETLGLVGESGCGKSTTGQGDHAAAARRRRVRCVFDGHDLTELARRGAAPARAPQMQMIFQDPISSLNPRRKVEDIVAEGLRHLEDRRRRRRSSAKVDEMLDAVGLDPDARRGPAAARVLRRPVPAHLDRPGASSPTRS